MIYYADIPNKSQKFNHYAKTLWYHNYQKQGCRETTQVKQQEHKQFDRQPHFVLDKICKTFVQSNSIISFLLCLTLCMTSLSCRYWNAAKKLVSEQSWTPPSMHCGLKSTTKYIWIKRRLKSRSSRYVSKTISKVSSSSQQPMKSWSEAADFRADTWFPTKR